jgi:endonuclease YncB( thermonuclease family)
MAKRRKYYAMSRKRKNAYFVLFFLFILPSLALLDRWAGHPVRQAVNTSLYSSDDWKKYHEQSFAIAAAIDGDTIDLAIPDAQHSTTRVRLLGIDTPETKHPRIGVMYYGPEASAFTKSLCENQTVTVLLDSAADQRDKYRRLLAYIRLPDGTILNERILAGGYGYAYLPFDHSHFDAYLELQNQAMAASAGLWKNATRKDLPEWLQKRRPDLLRTSSN